MFTMFTVFTRHHKRAMFIVFTRHHKRAVFSVYCVYIASQEGYVKCLLCLLCLHSITRGICLVFIMFTVFT